MTDQESLGYYKLPEGIQLGDKDYSGKTMIKIKYKAFGTGVEKEGYIDPNNIKIVYNLKNKKLVADFDYKSDTGAGSIIPGKFLQIPPGIVNGISALYQYKNTPIYVTAPINSGFDDPSLKQKYFIKNNNGKMVPIADISRNDAKPDLTSSQWVVSSGGANVNNSLAGQYTSKNTGIIDAELDTSGINLQSNKTQNNTVQSTNAGTTPDKFQPKNLIFGEPSALPQTELEYANALARGRNKQYNYNFRNNYDTSGADQRVVNALGAFAEGLGNEVSSGLYKGISGKTDFENWKNTVVPTLEKLYGRKFTTMTPEEQQTLNQKYIDLQKEQNQLQKQISKAPKDKYIGQGMANVGAEASQQDQYIQSLQDLLNQKQNEISGVESQAADTTGDNYFAQPGTPSFNTEQMLADKIRTLPLTLQIEAQKIMADEQKRMRLIDYSNSSRYQTWLKEQQQKNLTSGNPMQDLLMGFSTTEQGTK